MIRVVLVDDQELVRTGLAMVVDSQDDLRVVGQAADGAQALEVVATTPADVVLMDVRMPRMDGVEATRRLVAMHPDRPRVIVLTTFDLDKHAFAALKAGASGFLLKNAPPEELVHGVRVVAGGDALLAPSVTRRIVEEYAQRPAPRARDNGLERLTERELEVMRRLAGGKSNAELAAELYVGEGTVKSHVSSVLTKLGLRDRVQAVVYAYESGLVTPGS